METTRAGIAIYKINYKSDFILTVVCDVEWNTPFCIKFWTGEPSQAYYVGWTGHEYKNCKVVESDPSKLLVLFDDHHLPVGELKMHIVYHTTIEDFPNAIVDEVTNSMKVMAYIDGENQKVALDFEGEEDAELQFELPAYANEAQRIANEEQRIANEQARIEAEQQRIDNEQTRQDNEAQRIAQETARVNEYAELKANAVAATNAANDAATLASQKAQLAADKAALADAAATLAAQKAQLAADKAALADAAATLANQKAAFAQQKAEYAQTQGDYAKAQGDYAKEQGEIAEEDNERAEADHTRAESDHATAGNDHATAGNDHTQADTDHTRAESDHTKATSDHTQADTDHNRAESDHTQATSDHTQAGADHTRAESDHTTASADHTQAGQDHTRAESDHTRAESDHTAVEVYVDSLGAFDISAYHATGGVLAKYADLTAALGTGGANIPEAIRKGGMSVKFVQTYDNKYVQYRLMADAWSVDTNDWAIAEEGVYVENLEFIYVKLDVEDKILYGIKSDGEFFFGKGCPKQVKDYIEEKISSLSLDEYEDIVAFLSDYLGSDTTLKVMIDGINASLEDKLDAEGLDPDALGTVQAVENPEYVQVTTDSEDKILEATEKDGTKVFGGDVKLLGNMEVSGVSYKVIENPEYIEVKTDSEGKIISYRDSKGVLHECAGLETPSINGIPVGTPTGSFISPREYNLPKYGYVDIEKEISFTDGENSYAPTKISKVGGQYYVTSTLVDGQVTEDSVEVTLVESDIDIDTWPADKSTKHYSKVSIDCGNYLSGTYYIEVKFQGDSTLGYPKKNFRFTFYKDILFSKKVEQKIGELIAAKKYNLKAYWLDKALVREPACYRLVQAIRETRDYNQQYPWNPDYEIFTGATGIAMNFPVRIDVSGSFYGIHWFGLAKDINNFMLSDKTMNGVLIQGDDPGNQNPTYWKELDTYCWDDLLGDIDHAIGEDSLPAVQDFYHYINSEDDYTFNKETASEHFNITEWIDAIIILQVFCCMDSLAKNMILYAGEDKQVFSPMFYDMDWTWTFTESTNNDVFRGYAEAQDRSIWLNFMNLFWDEICDRYLELREKIFRMDYITPMMLNISRNIEYSDYESEIEKWGKHGSGTLGEHITWMTNRLVWCDSYFTKH